jgi:hypothetical protein
MSNQLKLFEPGEKRNETISIETVTNKTGFRKALTIDNLSHNMLIHGYLRAVHDYIYDFGLDNTAAFIIGHSGILKEDFIRCQLETDWHNEKMLLIIDKAFLKDPDEEIPEERDCSYEARVKALLNRAFEKKAHNGKYLPNVRFNYDHFRNQISKKKKR